MLEEGEILTLSETRKYTVIYSAELNGRNYAYLLEQDDYSNSMVCEYDNESGLEEITDPQIVEQFLIKFRESRNQR